MILGEAKKSFAHFGKSGVPAAWTILGVCHRNCPSTECRYGGDAWNYGPNLLTNECDVLIAIGMFDDRVAEICQHMPNKLKSFILKLTPQKSQKCKGRCCCYGRCQAYSRSIMPHIETKRIPNGSGGSKSSMQLNLTRLLMPK